MFATFKGSRTVHQPTGAHTVYVLQVESDGRSWLTFRRYREWHKLHEKLSALYANVPAIPGKSLFGSLSPRVIEARVRGLNTFLEACQSHVEISASSAFRDFLQEEQPPRGIEDADTLGELAAGGPAESGGGSDGPNSGEMAERTVQAFVDLHELAEPLESAAMAQRKQQHRPALEKALERPAKPAAPATLPAPAGGGDWSPERLASVAQRPALSGRDREVLKLAQAALKATVAEASAMTPVENLLLRVP